MPTLATALKQTIRRIARREILAETSKAKQTLSQYRRDITHLKRQLQATQKRMALVEALERKRLAEKPEADTEILQKVRFSPRSVRAHRARLGLSAEDYGKLLGVSRLTIYNWEHGKSRPRPAQLAALVALRKLKRREAIARLALLKSSRPTMPSQTPPQRSTRNMKS